ncbi:MAG: hypothetical protein OEV42_16140 [Deltaproteobacteria bacterium]|nr:hypothetical protein [Deltaproteobacteria bacterium]
MIKYGILFILLLGLIACSDVVDEVYKDLSEAKEAGAIQRGWIPAWLPATSYKIKETHDLDTNKSILMWKFDKEEKWKVPTSCHQIRPLEVRGPAINRSWWPPDLPESQVQTYAYVYYECEEGAFMAHKPDSYKMFFWQP